jgi:hypothetical protein
MRKRPVAKQWERAGLMHSYCSTDLGDNEQVKMFDLIEYYTSCETNRTVFSVSS